MSIVETIILFTDKKWFFFLQFVILFTDILS